MTDRLGDHLVGFVEASTDPVLLVAPFIKVAAFRRVLDAIPETTPVACVTRWRPDEVASGVSDLEILDRVRARQNTRLMLHPHLHAKYYRAGRYALVGSANLTGTALGWTEPSNLELLIRHDAETAELQAFESALFATVINATEIIRRAVADAAEAIKLLHPAAPGWRRSAPSPDVLPAANWLPTCPRPDLLFSVYNETIGDQLLSNARHLAERDLAFLDPPVGLGSLAFHGYIAAMLRQAKWVQDLDQLTNDGLTDTVAADLIRDGLPEGSDLSPEGLWSASKEWLIHFFPGQYDRLPAGEMLRKRRRSF